MAKIVRTLLNARFVTMLMLMMILKEDAIFISLENKEGSVHRDCNTNDKLNDKTSTVIHNLKNYESHLIIQELGK